MCSFLSYTFFVKKFVSEWTKVLKQFVILLLYFPFLTLDGVVVGIYVSELLGRKEGDFVGMALGVELVGFTDGACRRWCFFIN